MLPPVALATPSAKARREPPCACVALAWPSRTRSSVSTAVALFQLRAESHPSMWSWFLQ
jgi:hypothetical protein